MRGKPAGHVSEDRLTPQVRRALGEAAMAARRLGHSFIDTEHLVLGLLAEERGLGSQVLLDMGLEPETVEDYVRQFFANYPSPNDNQELVYTGGIDQALALASEEATWTGHLDVGTEHLLLGLMRWKESGAAEMLAYLGIPPGRVRRRVRQMQHAAQLEVGLEDARRMTSFSELAHRVLNGAIAEAARAGHASVGLEHVLLVLCKDRRNVAGRVLRELGVTVDTLQDYVSQLALPSALGPVFEAAEEEANRLGDHYIGTDHLLLAMTQQLEGTQTLHYLGQEPEEVYDRVLALMNH